MKAKQKSWLINLLVSFFLPLLIPIYAQQEDTIPGVQVDIVKEYRPWVAESKRLSFSPRLTPIKPPPVDARYRQAEHDMKIDFRPDTLPPLRAPREKLPKEKTFYALAGFGNLSSYEILAGIATPRKGDEYWFAEVALSSVSGKDYPLQKNTQFRISGGHYFQNLFASADLWTRTNYIAHYVPYPYDTTFIKALGDTIQTSQFVKRPLVHRWDASARASIPLSWTTLQMPARISLFASQKTEFRAQLGARGIRHINKGHYFGLGTYFDFLVGVPRQQRVFWQINPYYEFRGRKGIILHVGIKPVIGDTVYLIPDIYSEQILINDRLSYYAYFGGAVEPNALEDLFLENPYFDINMSLKPTDYITSIASLRFFPLDALKLEGTFTFRRYRNFRTWHWTYVDNQLKQKIIYDSKSDVLNFAVKATYQWTSYNYFEIKGEYFDYRMSDTLPFSHPRWTVSFLASTEPIPQWLAISTELKVLGQRYLGYDPAGKLIIDPIAFTSLFKADIKVFENGGIYLKLENFIYGKYYTWYPFKAFGTRVIGGLALSF